jgi:glucose/mannose-6-phosphate isomerase
MLDDLKIIHERDSQDALGAAAQQYEQLTQSYTDAADNFVPDNIVFGAMGGSALAAQLSQTWPGYTAPFEIVRGYDLPAYVSNKTLFIAASYSGGTEETISALAQAEQKGAHIMVITGGGKLAEIAQAKSYPLALLPKLSVTRYTTLANLRALLQLVQGTGVLAEKDALQQLESESDFLRQAIAAWQPEIPTKDNQAKRLAQELMGKSVVVYSGPKLASAAYKWKISLNENAKQVAWTNQLPELNHNEFTGWTKQPVEKPYAMVELRSSLEHPRVQRRFEVTEQLLSGMRPAPIVVAPEGQTLLQQLLWLTVLGDFVGIYTGIISGSDPTPLPFVDKLKQTL